MGGKGGKGRRQRWALGALPRGSLAWKGVWGLGVKLLQGEQAEGTGRGAGGRLTGSSAASPLC